MKEGVQPGARGGGLGGVVNEGGGEVCVHFGGGWWWGCSRPIVQPMQGVVMAEGGW